MRSICFGGTFNPIHNGHLICARAAAERAGLDRIILIPSAQPPHKPNSTDLVPAEHRLAMCRLAAGLCPELFEVDEIELRRATPSFTLDTVREIKSRTAAEVAWLIGADMLLLLPQWHRPLELIEEAQIYVLQRPGWEIDWPALAGPYQRLRSNVIPAPRLDISATDIRRRVAAGQSIAYLTPEPVANYIRQHGLYRTA
jgi:nicotinate-nucleotide adenylyltransferase